MFGTQLTLLTVFCIVIQVLILFEQFLHLFKRKKNKSTKRFVTFTILLIIYNLCSGLFPDKNISIPIYLQNIVAYCSGIVLAIYYVQYVYIEFSISPFKYLQVRTLIRYLSLTFVGLFIIPYLLYNDLALAKQLFLIFPILLAILFLFQVTIPIYKLCNSTSKDKYYRNRIVAGYVALLSLSLMPVIVAFGNVEPIEQSVVNFGYFWLAVALIKHNIHQSKKRDAFLIQLGYIDLHNNAQNINITTKFKKLNFSEREIEIANYILEGFSYKEIGNYLFIAEGTVSKHASNIFKKTDTPNKKAFITLFMVCSV